MGKAEGEKAAHTQGEDAYLAESSLNAGGRVLSGLAAQPPSQPQPENANSRDSVPGIGLNPIRCPECSSSGPFYKDGMRYLADGTSVQRWLCRVCGYRFSDSKMHSEPLQKIRKQSINRADGQYIKRQVCVGEDPAKNLAKAVALTEVSGETTSGPAGATAASQTDVKGKILEFAWWLKKNGKSEATIQSRTTFLKMLLNKGANLLDPEDVKSHIAAYPCAERSKTSMVDAYKSFTRFLGLKWEPPKYKRISKIPFIPLEREIDDLIACCSKRTAALTQLIKETGCRLGEALQLKWIDLDGERKVVRIEPEKGSNPRILKISDKLLGMITRLPKESEYIFGGRIKKGVYIESLRKARKKAALKLQNPRLLHITYHTLRHWKGTMEYHLTKDPWHVKRILGHKSLQSTEIYINIEQALFDKVSEEFHVKVAQTPDEIKALLEVGFEYVCQKDGLMFFRKRK